MATRQELRTLVRRRLGDMSVGYIFADEQINQWINDAIADYSSHFPQAKMAELECTTDLQQYMLPADFRGLLKVEYPEGEDPPVYLARLDHRSTTFQENEGYYDVFTMVTAEISEPPWITDQDKGIYISEKPASGEFIRITYTGDHDYLDEDTDVTTVPDRHFELLVHFCRWAAFQELAMSEALDPEPTGLLAGTLELDAVRAERQYRKELQMHLQSEGVSRQAAWQMDANDRVY